ncbi:dynein axonemal light chain 1-like [Chironomus tepperi]|uniref:dynein axonemal light chain 1-like n=1 Tax=Chironomus tepperi TaxID=113505 RepID=UPI00391F5222
MSDRPTTIKEALDKWEKKNEMKASEATEIGLQFQMPPIEKMTPELAALKNCEKLSLSTNNIDRIVLPPLPNLKILALGRNNIKSFAGLEVLCDTLEQLWISYNSIEKLKGIELMKKLKVLYMGYNSIKDWNEVSKLTALSETLTDFNIYGNPVIETSENYRVDVIQRLPFLKMLDGEPALI